jgi:peroxiredoxin
MKVFNIWMVLAAVVFCRYAGAIEFRAFPDPQPAPPLALADLAGKRHSLADLKGKVVLVNFWASWCQPCVAEMPGMQRLLSSMAKRPFTILAVNSKEPKATVWRFKKLLNIGFTTLLDRDGQVSQAWDVEVYPTSFLIDAEGRVRYAAYGAVEWDSAEAREKIEQLMPDTPGSMLETRNSTALH